MTSSATRSARGQVAVRLAVLPGKTPLLPQCDSSASETVELPSQCGSSEVAVATPNFKVRSHCECSHTECPGTTAAKLKRGDHCSDCACKDTSRPFKIAKKSSGRKKSGNALYPGQLAQGTAAWKAERAEVKARSGGRCERKEDDIRCPRWGTELHHIQSRKRLGSDYADNLLDLCLHCHGWVHAHPKLATEQDLMRRGEVTA